VWCQLEQFRREIGADRNICALTRILLGVLDFLGASIAPMLIVNGAHPRCA